MVMVMLLRSNRLPASTGLVRGQESKAYAFTYDNSVEVRRRTGDEARGGRCSQAFLLEVHTHC